MAICKSANVLGHKEGEKLTGPVAATLALVTGIASLGDRMLRAGHKDRWNGVLTLLSRLRLPPLTKATLAESPVDACFADSGEDRMVMRENSPFMPWGGEPGMLGEMATT